MKKLLIIFAALAIMAGSCSKEEGDAEQPKDNPGNNQEGDGTEKPGNNQEDTIPVNVESSLLAGNDTRPDWEAPNYDNWEQTMSVRILPQKILEPYVTEGDLLCAMMNDEVRGLTEPVFDPDMTFFPLTVGADGAEAKIFLYYYCDSLHRIYSTEWTDFNASLPPMGEDGIYRPEFAK